MHRIYFAAPLFNCHEKAFNEEVTNLLETEFSVFLPQRDGALLEELLRDGFSSEEAKNKIFQHDVQEIDNCDLIFIVLNGASIDEGAAFELGYAFSKGKTCIGLQTDSRRLLCTGNNPMIDSACIKILTSTDNLAKTILSILPK